MREALRTVVDAFCCAPGLCLAVWIVVWIVVVVAVVVDTLRSFCVVE